MYCKLSGIQEAICTSLRSLLIEQSFYSVWYSFYWWIFRLLYDPNLVGVLRGMSILYIMFKLFD